MMTGTYYPRPLEDYPKEEMELLARQRIDEYITYGNMAGSPNSSTQLESGAVRTRKERLDYCRAMWNDELDEQRFDYLYNKVTKKVQDESSGIDDIITMEMPAKVRNIPIVRNKLQALISKEMSRPLITKVMGMTEDMANKKLTKIKDDVLDKQMAKINLKRDAQRTQQALLQQQQQLIQQMGQDPQAQQLIMQMQAEMEKLQEVLNRDIVVTAKEVEAIREYYQYNHKEFEEQLASQALEEYLDSKRIRVYINDAFKELMINGEPIWYCNWEEGLPEPETRIVRPEHVWYQYNESARYLHQLDWIVEYQPLSLGQVIQMYGHKLTSDQLNLIRTMRPLMNSDQYMRTNLGRFPGGAPWTSNNGLLDYRSNHEVDVYKVFWKEQVEVYALYTPNKNDTPYFAEKPPFVRFITAAEAEELSSTDAKKAKLKKKGQVIKKAYRVDLWEAVRIGESLYVDIHKADFQYRTSDRLSDVPLPYIGHANNKFNKAYSPLWETKDIQELWNILHYQEELLIALAGVKGIIYDLSQIPNGMSPQELMYYFKQGLGLIETMTPEGKPKKTTFNQFSTYDMTVSPAIQTITMVKESLNQLVGEITGVTRQQTGQVAASDQVGTSQMALQQSNVVVEYYYQQLDELTELLCTRLTNIFPYAYAEGKKGMYILGKERQEILNIQKGQLKGEFRTVVNAGNKEREIMQQAKQIGQLKFQQGAISASNLIDMLDTDTMFEMRKMLKKYEDEAMEKAQAMQSQQVEQQKQAQVEVEQMKAQMTQQVAQMSAQIEQQLVQLKGQIELQKEQVKAQNKVAEIEQRTIEAKDKIAIDGERIKNEREIEMAYLEFSYKELEVNAANQRAQMLINRAKTTLELGKAGKKEKVSDR